MSRGDSIRQTASMVRCVSGAVTSLDHTTFDAPYARSRRVPCDLPPDDNTRQRLERVDNECDRFEDQLDGKLKRSGHARQWRS